MTAKGSGSIPPVKRFAPPYRVVRVVKTEDGYDVTGESQSPGEAEPVTWRVMSFGTRNRTREEAAREADATAHSFGSRLPPWFKGNAYVVDSAGKVTEVGVDEGDAEPERTPTPA